MRRFALVLSFLLFSVGALSASGQVVPAATGRHISLVVGGMGSIFQPDYAGVWQDYYPVAQPTPRRLFGVGAYADLKLSRWVQIEGEARWLRWHRYADISEDHYLIGPRIPILRFSRMTIYGKALLGIEEMNFDAYGDHGSFTDLALGGGVDVKLTHRISLRALDAEYQYLPQWGNSTLSPYGASVGIGYRIF